MGVCETQFAKRLPLLSEQLRTANKKKIAEDKQTKYLQFKTLLTDRFAGEVDANIATSRKIIRKELMVSVHHPAFSRAWREVFS
jgi:hypothetical protein